MARATVIRKNAAELRVAPNLRDLDAERAAFSWDAARRELQGLPGGGLNIAHEAVDRHASGPRAAHVALRWLAASGGVRAISYAELAGAVNRFANLLRGLGVAKGDAVFVLCGRIPELYAAVLGALKCGAVVAPLFSAFGPQPLKTRVNLGRGKVLVTTASLYERRVKKVAGEMPTLEHVLQVDGADFRRMFDSSPAEFEIEKTVPEDPSFLHFTSGTTGMPKGAVHVHGAVVAHHATGKYALDLHPEDVFWCTADPGWITGTSYGIVAPLAHGVTSIVDEAEFDAERWYRILQDERVTVWYTAPTAIRLLMKAGAGIARQFRFPQLRFVASVGEPLNPEAVWWGKEVLGLPIHDNWWQTETGGIMIANTPAMDVKPGSMGKPLPGIEACIVHRKNSGIEIVGNDDVEGELALRAGWPSMFRGYLGEEARYRKCFADGLYLTGDLARRDADGYYWFVGRADDVIKSAGHLIGPFEVESVLMEHPAVAEAGVIGKPDPVVGEIVKAFVSLKAGFVPAEELKMQLLAHARKRLGAAVAPKEIAFAAQLPRTRSGKIMRRLLKARELGLPEGDLSTLEGPT
ncbi:MAG: acetate--CoA ligase [Betaproteobacteria bacterium RBG_16_66_20]|nr:MAG: acetate--CoA ligase [Betaproteobacteria bacterium RBG_16_66_20]